MEESTQEWEADQMVNKSITRVSCISNIGGKEEKTNMLKREVIGTELIILEERVLQNNCQSSVCGEKFLDPFE